MFRVEQLSRLVEALLHGPEDGVEGIGIKGFLGLLLGIGSFRACPPTIALLCPITWRLYIDVHFILDINGVAVVRGDVLDMVFSAEVDGALVSKREALEHEDEDPTTECRVERSGEAPKQLIAGAKNNQLLLFKVLRCDTLAARLEKVENLFTSGNDLAVEELLDEPEEQGGVALLAVREDGKDVEKVPNLGEVWRVKVNGSL